MADDKQPQSDERTAISKLTRFLTEPKNVIESNTISVLETQANLNNNPLARLILYERKLAKEFEIFNPDGKDAADRINKPEIAATMLSLMSQGDNARARNDAVTGLVRVAAEKKPISMEDLAVVSVAPPEGQEIRKKLGL